jgi:beta-D-xylosidase 4
MVVFSALALSIGALVIPVRGGVTYPNCASGPLKSNVVCDTSAAPAARAAALVAAMNNNEKLANLIK